MRRLYRRVLRELLGYLDDNLLVTDRLIDQLYSTLALGSNEKEIIEHEKCNRDKINRLVLSLSPKNDDVYEKFKESLRQTLNEEVIEELQKKETSLEPEIGKFDADAKSLILGYFKKDPDAFTCLYVIEDTLLGDWTSRSNPELIQEILDDKAFLSEAIKSAFPESKESTRPVNSKKRKKRSRKNLKHFEIGFEGFSLVNPSEELNERERQESESSQCSDVETIGENCSNTEVYKETQSDDIKSVKEFYNWVKNVLKENFDDTSAAEKLRDNDIDGFVFDQMPEQDLKEFLPKYGQRKKIITLWNERKSILKANASEQSTSYDEKSKFQEFRPFDCQAAYKHKYSKGAFFQVTEKRPGNQLSPVHKYVSLNSVERKKEAHEFAMDVIRFGSACMNEKTNGTIHFGISTLENGKSQISGCRVATQLIERMITKLIRMSFYDGQVSIALSCIRPPQFIEVIGENLTQSLYVVEVDVVPATRFVERFAYFLKTTDDDQQQSVIYRFDGKVNQLDCKQTDQFMKEENEKLFSERQKLENLKYTRQENKNKHLQDFLCGGSKYLELSTFPIVILNNNNGQTAESLKFLKYIKWRAVFDFSPFDVSDTVQKYFETNHDMAFNTNYIEDFDPRKCDEKTHKQTTDIVIETALPNWIYCNGSKSNSLTEPSQWKIERLGSFRKAFETFLEQCSPGRERILILLLGHDSITTEAVEEVFIKCQTNCLVLSESETISSPLRESLQRRNIFLSSTNIDNLFLDGLPWNQVLDAVKKFSKAAVSAGGLEISRSNGVPFELPETEVQQLCDIEIVGRNNFFESKETESDSHDDKVAKMKESRESFYSGGTASWSNFNTSDEVLVREIHPPLYNYVYEAMSSNSYHAVKKVILYHQPGAGGSTTSRQILWNLRGQYRCCIVKNVTKQTCEQINRFRMYGEESEVKASPVLVLIDIDEEDKLANFCDEIISEGQKSCCETYAVLLICCRVSEVPTNRGVSPHVFLEQHLSDSETIWFRKKSKDLTEWHSSNRGSDPDTLLAFNLMKANYDQNSIDKSITKYVTDPLLTNDYMLLLKYVSFINYFDLGFQPVPMHCFDHVLSNLNWVNHIPQPFRILVNTNIQVNGVCGEIPCLRIATNLMSRLVLNAVLKYEKQKGEVSSTVGEVAKELLHSKVIPQHVTAQYDKMFEKILGNIVKKRGFTGEKLNQFCNLVTELLENKDVDLAIDIVDRIYYITDDPMVGQQQARLHAEMQNWNEAQASIAKAIKQKPDQSYLMHTRGQIYKLEFDNYVKENKNKLDESQIERALEIAKNAVIYFKECQKISRTENVFPQNPAGFDGEIKVGIDILKVIHPQDVISICEKQHHQGYKFKDVCGGCMCKFLKGMPDDVFSAIEILEADIYFTEKENEHSSLHCDHFLTILASGLLESYKKEFQKLLYGSIDRYSYKGEDVHSFIAATKADNNTLIRILQNSTIGDCNLGKKEIRKILASALELFLRDHQVPQAKYDEVLYLSRMFYEQATDTNPTCTLEAHLMITALHWPLPLKNTIRDKLCPHSLFIGALLSWQTFVNEKPIKPRGADKIICYLSNVTFPCLVRAEKATKEKIYILEALVCHGGSEVEMKPHAFRSRNIAPIRIATLNKIRMSTYWNKTFPIVIGFGLNGPKAQLLQSINFETSFCNNPQRVVEGQKQFTAPRNQSQRNRGGYTQAAIGRHNGPPPSRQPWVRPPEFIPQVYGYGNEIPALQMMYPPYSMPMQQMQRGGNRMQRPPYRGTYPY